MTEFKLKLRDDRPATVEERRSLVEALVSARIQLSALGGTAGIHMSDEDAAETGCDMIQRAVINQIDAALKTP